MTIGQHNKYNQQGIHISEVVHVKIINTIVINGEKVAFDELSEEKKEKISNCLNSTALRQLGCEAEDKTA